MSTSAFETLTRQAADAVSRRSSLLTLGGAAVAAGVTNTGVSDAKKKKGKDCKKKEKQRCNNDAAACKATIQPLCDPGDPASCLEAQACCEECSADGFLTCLLAASASIAAKFA
jgi:hypothetical protein